MALILTRKIGEFIVIDERIKIVFKRISRKRVQVAIIADKEIPIRRGELEPRERN